MKNSKLEFLKLQIWTLILCLLAFFSKVLLEFELTAKLNTNKVQLGMSLYVIYFYISSCFLPVFCL